MRHYRSVYLWLVASRPPMTLAVTTLPTLTEDVGKDPWRTSLASTTSDTCTLPMLPSSSVTWMQVGFTDRTLACRMSPKQWPLELLWFSETVRCRFGAVRCQDTRGSPCSSSQLGSMTSTAKHIPALSFSDSDRKVSFRWLLVWIMVSWAVSSSEMVAKSLSMCCSIAVYFDSSFNCKNTHEITIVSIYLSLINHLESMNWSYYQILFV